MVVVEELKQICTRLEKSDETLTLLNLSCRGICSEGVIKMADAVEADQDAASRSQSHHDHRHHQQHQQPRTATATTATSLVALWLEGNEIYSSGGRALRRLLNKSPQLKYLYLSNNHIGDGGMNALAPVALSQLDVCHVGDNDIGPFGLYGIAETLSGGRVRIGQQQQQPAGATATEGSGSTSTATVTSTTTTTHSTVLSPTISTLVMDNNQLSDEGAKLLAESLRYNTSLKHLDVRHNKIGVVGLMEFRDILKNKDNTTLQSIYFDEIDEKPSSDDESRRHCTRCSPSRRRRYNRNPSRAQNTGRQNNNNNMRTATCCDCERCIIRYEIDYYLALNRSGRSHLGDVTVPSGCWSRIMSRVVDTTHRQNDNNEMEQQQQPSVLYTILTDRPDIFRLQCQ
jgi:Leucine Rich repeat